MASPPSFSSASAPSSSSGSQLTIWERIKRPSFAHRAEDDAYLDQRHHQPPLYHQQHFGDAYYQAPLRGNLNMPRPTSSDALHRRQSRHLSVSPYPFSPSSTTSSPLPSPITRGRPNPSVAYTTRSRVNKSGYTRSRTGCFTCRQQKKKCDEVRPECSRCRNNGHKCEYPNERQAIGIRSSVENYFYPQQQKSLEFRHALSESQSRLVNVDISDRMLPPLSASRPRVSYKRTWPSPEVVRKGECRADAGVKLPPISTFDDLHHLPRPSLS